MRRLSSQHLLLRLLLLMQRHLLQSNYHLSSVTPVKRTAAQPVTAINSSQNDDLQDMPDFAADATPMDLPSAAPAPKRKLNLKIGMVAAAILLAVGVAAALPKILKSGDKPKPVQAVQKAATAVQKPLNLDNKCFTLKFPSAELPYVKTADINMKDTSTGSSCSFIFQYESLADTPIAAGEVFTGSFTWAEKRAFIPSNLAAGKELDILGLSKLANSTGKAMVVQKQYDIVVDGQKAAFFHPYIQPKHIDCCL